MAKLDLPDPLTPVTTVRAPRGRVRSMFRRLFCRAPSTRMIRAGAPTSGGRWDMEGL
jgi:hypothetical protein